MSCSVNLVPAAQLHRRTRGRRRTRWVWMCSTVGVLLVAGWGIRQAAAAALTHLTHRAGALDVQRTEVKRRLAAAETRRDALLDQLRTVAAARCPQPWPRRLMTLTSQAPEGVFLTVMNVSTPEESAAGTPRTQTRRPAESKADEKGLAHVGREAQTVRLMGYALDHGALLQFVSAVQSLPEWEHVELVRAAQEPYRGGTAVSFELDCRIGEDQP